MRRSSIGSIIVIAVLAVASPGFAEDAGDLQVTCRPGYRLYLDGVFVGLTTAEEDGLYLRGVPAGSHLLRVEKLGFVPADLRVEVVAGRPVEVKVGELVPEGTAVAAAPPPPPPTATALPSGAAAASPQSTIAAPATAPPRALRQPPIAPPAPAPTPHPIPTPSPVLTPAPEPPASSGQGVAFVYRVQGAALAPHGVEHRSVSVYRERGGPRAPALVLLCTAAPCEDRAVSALAPGRYLFRVTFRSWTGEGRNAHDLFGKDLRVEVEADAGRTYSIDVSWDGESDDACRASVREVR